MLGKLDLILLFFAFYAPIDSCLAQLTILDTEFSASEGYQNGDLQFQSITDGTAGTWLGHSGASVNTDDFGSVSRTADPRRNLFGRGATGGTAGGNGESETDGDGFTFGDTLTVTHGYSFEVSQSSITGLLRTGVRPNYVNGGFESTPLVGISLEYLNAGTGSLLVFGNVNRSANNSGDDAFAVTVDAANIGIDNDAQASALDLTSDNLVLTWVGEYVDVDTWKTQEIIIENEITQSVTRASEVNPSALEEVMVPGSGDEAFFGMQPLQGVAGAGVTYSVALFYDQRAEEIPGDFDSDFDVDGTDFLTWQNDRLSTDDLANWELNYGRSTTAEQMGILAVPEASCFHLIASGLLMWSISRSNKRHSLFALSS